VFFASVLFFAGISLRIGREWLRMAVLGLGVAFLGYGVVHLILLPTL
jgi:VIT1/CCC1 family predicted Fe2+/Mn2+ transporter